MTSKDVLRAATIESRAEIEQNHTIKPVRAHRVRPPFTKSNSPINQNLKAIYRYIKNKNPTRSGGIFLIQTMYVIYRVFRNNVGNIIALFKSGTNCS